MTDEPTPTDEPTDEPTVEPERRADAPLDPSGLAGPADGLEDDDEDEDRVEAGGRTDIYDALEAAADAKPKKKGKKKKTKVVVQQVTPAWVRWAGIATVVVVAALAIVAVQQSRHADDVTSEAHDRTAAERVAGEFSETLFTFDATSPTAHLDRLRQLATKAYQPKVDEARQTALAGGTTGATQASMTAHVTDVYLTELSGDQAHAVTRSDWVLTAGGQTLSLDLYLQVDLKRDGGTWKVNTVSALTAKQPTAATTTTTAPASGGASSTTATTAATSSTTTP